MLDDPPAVQWRGRSAIVTMPDHVSVANVDLVREQLLSVINRGATMLIVDMSDTVSCDHAAVDMLARAYQRAAASRTPLRLVVTAPLVRCVISVEGLDRLVPVYSSLEAAIDALGDGLALVDDGGEIVLVNRSCTQMFGYRRVLAVIRDPDGGRHGDLAELARSAVLEQSARVKELLERVPRQLFQVGLSLEAAAELPGEVARQRITDALDRLDETIHEIRDYAFGSPDGPPPGAGPPNGSA